MIETENNYIFDENFLLQNDAAKRLYHDYAAEMPIIDYHCHLPVKQIAEDYSFKNLTDIWLRGDHYKWRALRTLGVEERYITGNATDEEKFLRWAEIVPETLRNPLFHWTHLELKNPFGVETYLNKNNAKEIYGYCNYLLEQSNYSARDLLIHFNVSVVCTTDDPCDSLGYHEQLEKDDFKVSVLPGFRPDAVFNIKDKKQFRKYIQRLSAASDVAIERLDDLLKALQNRIDYFHAHNGSVADHGLSYLPDFDLDIKKTNQIFQKALEGSVQISNHEADQFIGFLLYKLCSMYNEKGWVQQFHLGPLRSVNSRKQKELGANTGFDSIGDFQQAPGLAAFLNKLEKNKRLGKTIIYNINPKDNELFATMVRNFNEGPERGKIQYGAAWWFLDQLDGMEEQLNTLSNMGILSTFIGMLTDSRSFLSYSRHEYFRRLLCNIFGKEIESGLLPKDEKWIGGVIQDICFTNAAEYFGWK